MKRSDPTDLVCTSRREPLPRDQERRLHASLQYSLEVRLMSQLLPELEDESRARPGDELLLARIEAAAVAAAQSTVAAQNTVAAPDEDTRTTPLGAAAKRRSLLMLVAVAAPLVASFAGAWLGS